MRQVLHIFAKDVRRLRYEILLVLATAATFAWVDGHAVPWSFNSAVTRADRPLKLLLILAWWFLVARTIYDESPVGHTQFWLTRPYDWRKLLGAKLLFVIAFINLPLFFSDCAIVAMRGFDPLAYPAALAWHQLVVCVWLLLPVVALACVTESISQLALAGFVVLLTGVLTDLLSPPASGGVPGSQWVVQSVIGVAVLLAALATVWLQYRARRAWVGRSILAGALGIFLVLPPLVPFGASFAWQNRVLKSRIVPSGITLKLSTDKSLPKAQQGFSPTEIGVQLPVDLAGLPAGVQPVAYKAWATLYLPGSRRPWSSYGVDMTAADPSVFIVSLPRAKFVKLRTGSVRVQLVAYIGLYGDPRSGRLPLEPGTRRVPGIGICGLVSQHLSDVLKGTTSYRWIGWQCETPFRKHQLLTARLDASKEWGQPLKPLDNSPYPASFGISPMSQMGVNLYYKPGSSAAVLARMQPFARIQREIDIPGSRFANLNYPQAPAGSQ